VESNKTMTNGKPRRAREELVCCFWAQIQGVQVHIKYCYGETQFRLKVHLPGNDKALWREFSPPNKMLQNSCNNYIRILALAFRFGGNDFKRELRYQAKKALWRMRQLVRLSSLLTSLLMTHSICVLLLISVLLFSLASVFALL